MNMRRIYLVAKRELAALFFSPVAYVFLVIFLLLTSFFTFMLGHFFQYGEASLQGFFLWQPWLFLFLVPAIGMRLWAEEHRQGTLELLFTLPVTIWEAVLGKYLAGLFFLGMALFLTAPMPFSVCYLGSPDWGPMLTGYAGSFLLAGTYLAVTAMTSACTRNQVISFITSSVSCFLLALAGYPPMTEFLLRYFPSRLPVELAAACSVVFHYESLQRGVVDFRDLLYFASLLSFFLFGTVVVLRHGRRKSGGDALSLLAMACLWICLNGLCHRIVWRWDCTEEKLYTLSETTRKVLEELPPNVDVRFYFSRDLVQVPVGMRMHAGQVDDLLREYERQSGRRLRVHRLNPAPDTDAEDAARMDGMMAQGLAEENGSGGLYLGVSVSCQGRKASLPFLEPQRAALLEYDLTRMILAVVRPSPRKVGLLSPLPLAGGVSSTSAAEGKAAMRPAWKIVQELRKDFEVVEMAEDAAEIPEDVGVLLVVHPRNMPEKTEMALDRFVRRGGKLAVFLDPLCMADLQTRGRVSGQRYVVPDSCSDLPRLLAAWGMRFRNEVVLDRRLATMVRTSAQAAPEAMYPVLTLGEEQISQEDSATSRLSQLNLVYAGCFEGEPAPSLHVTPLLESTEESQLVEAYATQRTAGDIARLFRAEGGRRILGLRLAGRFPAAFPQKEGADAPRDSVVVLVGDADMLYDAFCLKETAWNGRTYVQPQNHNLAFLENVLEGLSGDASLFEIRSRGGRARGFTRLQKLELAAEGGYQEDLAAFEKERREFREELRELQRTRGKELQQGLLTQEQRALVERVQKREGELRSKLRMIRRKQRRQVNALENKVMLWNLCLTPGMVVLAGMAVWGKRRFFRKGKTA